MQIREYNHGQDYDRVGDFLIETYEPGDYFLNWLQPRWEYMHHHPFIKEVDLTKIGIMEDDGRIVGVVHPESSLREVFLQIRPGYEHIKRDLLDHAEKYYGGTSVSTGRQIRAVYINELDPELEGMVSERGYEKWPDFGEGNSLYKSGWGIPEITLPEGYHLQSLADACDFRKINSVLWRGFDHPGPPPDEEIPGREEMVQAPNFRKDLTIVAVEPGGNYVSYGGMWVVHQNRVAYLEPVATDPDYRRMGLGRAVVLECVRRAFLDGADVAWVGSEIPFYSAIGFKPMFAVNPWVKYLD